jgi:pseudouridine-5'-monophosphatase
MLGGIECVIFDLDGTLLDTEGLYTDAARNVCARYGAVYTLELKRRVMGGDTFHGAQLVTRELGLPLSPQAYIAEREQELNQLLPRATAMPGAQALVAALAALPVKLAIATSGHRAITQRKLAHHAFLSVIPWIVCGDDPQLTRPKPAPDIYLLAAHKAGAQAQRCMAIEDSVHGVSAGVAAGMRTVALVDPRWGFPPEDFAAAHQLIHSLEELVPGPDGLL